MLQNEQLKFTAERVQRAHGSDMAIVLIFKDGKVQMGHAGMDYPTTVNFVDGLREMVKPVPPGTLLKA